MNPRSVKTDRSAIRPVYGLSQRFDPEQQGRDVVPTGES
jgi:hypothetical protein